MKYEKLIIEKLISKYEKSKMYKEINLVERRVLLKADQHSLKEINFENAEEKQGFIESLQKLKSLNIVDFTWIKFEKGNLIKEIWLIIDNIDKAYHFLERRSKKEIVDDVFAKIHEMEFKHFLWMNTLKIELGKNYESDKSYTKVLPKDSKIAKELILLLTYLDKEKGNPNYIRIISAKLFNDSKYFSKVLQSPLISLARRFADFDDEMDDEEILESLGIIKHTQMVEFCGAIKISTTEGIFDFSDFKSGAVINSNTVNYIIKLVPINIKNVLFIENKTVYEKVVYSIEKFPNWLIVYHGGFYGPTKANFINHVFAGVGTAGINYYHWSDIDLGGFRIFARLKREIIPCLIPYKMDMETLKKNQQYWIKTDKKYQAKLSLLKKSEQFNEFHDTIDFMIKNNCRLEQEVLLGMDFG